MYLKHLFFFYLPNLQDENRKQKIDLQKLFTPSDFEEIKPGKTRKCDLPELQVQLKFKSV